MNDALIKDLKFKVKCILRLTKEEAESWWRIKQPIFRDRSALEMTKDPADLRKLEIMINFSLKDYTKYD